MCGRWNKPVEEEMTMLRGRLHWKGLLTLLGLVAASAAWAQTPDASAPPRAGTLDSKSCSKPAYPHGELAAGQRGTVTVQLRIDTNGSISASRILQSSGFPALDEATRSALAKCRFTPVKTPEGKLVPAWTAVQYVWNED
jgi:bla regulator protein BlaR1